MIDTFKSGKDIYAVFAQAVYDNEYQDNLEFYPEGKVINVDGKEVVCGYKTHKNVDGKKRRGTGKILNLAVTYGMGANSIAERTGKSYQEGQEILDSFYKRFSTLKKWIDSTLEFAKKNGYVKGLYNRRRHLTDVNLPLYEVKRIDSNKGDLVNFNPFLSCENRDDDDLLKWKKLCATELTKKKYLEYQKQAKEEGISIMSNSAFIASAERQTANSVIQGSAATLTKIAMINIFNDKELNDLGFRLLITVHDEVLGECPEENARAVEKRLNEVMVNSLKPYLAVPISCDLYTVHSWYEDELKASIQKRYSDLEKTMSKEEAYNIIKNEHCELLKEQLDEMLK